MKICAVVAEYNPLHLGHLKQIEYMKSLSAVGVVKKSAKNVLQHLPNSIISFIKYIYYKV